MHHKNIKLETAAKITETEEIRPRKFKIKEQLPRGQSAHRLCPAQLSCCLDRGDLLGFDAPQTCSYMILYVTE